VASYTTWKPYAPAVAPVKDCSRAVARLASARSAPRVAPLRRGVKQLADTRPARSDDGRDNTLGR